MSDYREDQPTAEELDEWYGELLPDGASFKDANEYYSRAFPLPPIPKPKTAEEYAAMRTEEQLEILKEELYYMYDNHGCCVNSEILKWIEQESNGTI